MMPNPMRQWLAGHLAPITVALLALWLPPVLMTVAVGVGLIAGQGYPRLTDPGLLLSIVELALMGVAVPHLSRRCVFGWRLLVWSRVAILAQTGWVILVYSRLFGIRATLQMRSIIEAIAGLLIAGYALAQTRELFEPCRNHRRPALWPDASRC